MNSQPETKVTIKHNAAWEILAIVAMIAAVFAASFVSLQWATFGMLVAIFFALMR